MQTAFAVRRTRWCAQTKEIIMRIPAILQGEARTRFLQGIAFGAVAAMAIGFIWGGWVTEGTARAMSATAESNGRMSILVPAKSTVSPLVSELGFEALDAGALKQARILEPFAMVWINQALIRGLGRNWAFGVMHLKD
jgi:hypothetical protein